MSSWRIGASIVSAINFALVLMCCGASKEPEKKEAAKAQQVSIVKVIAEPEAYAGRTLASKANMCPEELTGGSPSEYGAHTVRGKQITDTIIIPRFPGGWKVYSTALLVGPYTNTGATNLALYVPPGLREKAWRVRSAVGRRGVVLVTYRIHEMAIIQKQRDLVDEKSEAIRDKLSKEIRGKLGDSDGGEYSDGVLLDVSIPDETP